MSKGDLSRALLLSRQYLSTKGKHMLRGVCAVALMLGGCDGVDEEAVKRERTAQFYADLTEVNAVCGISNYGFDPLVGWLYNDNGPPEKSVRIPYFSYENFTEEQFECVHNYKGIHGYTFYVEEYDLDLHGDG